MAEIQLVALDQSEAQLRETDLAWDTDTGEIRFASAPSTPDGVANKAYVDAAVGVGFVLKSGDTMTGRLTLSADPTNNKHAATKSYVDGIGDTASAAIAANTAAIATLDATTYTKTETDATFLTIAAASAKYVELSGDTMTGRLTLSGDPTSDRHAATKAYVDAVAAGGEGGGSFVHIDGDTMTGTLYGTNVNMSDWILAGGNITSNSGRTYLNSASDGFVVFRTDDLVNRGSIVSLASSRAMYLRTCTAAGATANEIRIYSDASSYAAEFLLAGSSVARVDPAGTDVIGSKTVITREKGDERYIKSDGSSINIQPLTFANKEPNDLSSDGQISFDSSRGIIVYRTQQVGDASGNGAYTVLDSSNIKGGSNISISGIATDEGGTTPITFNLTNTVSIAGSFTANGAIKSNNVITADDDNGGFTIGNGGTNCYLDAKNGTDLQFRFDGTTKATVLQNGNIEIYNDLIFSRSGASYVSWKTSGNLNFRADGQNVARIDDDGGLGAGTSLVNRSAGDDRYARSSVSAGSVGTYGMLYASTSGGVTANQTQSGSNLYWSAASNDRGSSVSGTWRCQGYVASGGSNEEKVTLWLRIS